MKKTIPALLAVKNLSHTPLTPSVIDLEYDKGRSYEYEHILKKPKQDSGPSFHLPPSVNATPASLCELFLPDSLLDKWVVFANDYAASSLRGLQFCAWVWCDSQPQ